MPNTWLVFDRIRAFVRSNRLYQHERVFQDQSQLDRIVAGSEYLDWNTQASILDQTNLQINRLQRYKDYDQIDQTGVGSLSLDLYADESSLIDPERKRTLVIRARSRRLKKELEELFFQTLQWDSQCRACIRYLCKFGDCPWEVIPTRNRDGVGSIKHMNVYNFTRVETKYGDLVGFFFQDDYIPEPIFLHPWQVMHLRLTSLENIFHPYGKSILDGGRKAFKQLRLCEDAALIYRITRAPEKRMFKIPVGLIPAKEVPEYMEIIARKFKRQRFYNPQTNTFDERYSPLIQEDDYMLPVRCLNIDTEIWLLDGTKATLGNLNQKYGQAGKFWVYSYDLENKKFIPKQARCVIGPKQAKMIKITLDDGSTIESTLDHKFYKLDGSQVQAIDLKISDSLLVLYRQHKKLRAGKNVGKYEQVLDPFTGVWEFTHRLVLPNCPSGYVRHHKDFNRFNNEPGNLELMTVRSHKQLHADHGGRIMKELQSRPEMKEKFLLGTERGIKEYNKSDRAQEEHQAIRAPFVRDKWKDGDYNHTVGKNHVHYVNLDEYKEVLRGILIKTDGLIRPAVELWNSDDSLCEIWFANKHTISTKIKEWGYSSSYEFAGIKTPEERKQELFDVLFETMNLKITCQRLGLAKSTVNGWLKQAGYSSVADFLSQPRNHKVVKIEILDEPQDTYCLEVEDTHNFMLANGVIVHNSDGTGPDITTLPGAENLDQIADIEYFKKNMVAPMKIPFARVGIGEDAGKESEKSLSSSHPEFAKAVQWVQRETAAGLTKIAIIHLALRGYSVEDIKGFELSLPSTSAIEELYRIETWQTRVQVMSDLKELGWFPKEWIVTHFTDLTPDEILELKEMEELASEGDKAGIGGEEGLMGAGGGGGLGGLGGGMEGGLGDLGGEGELGDLGGEEGELGGEEGVLGGEEAGEEEMGTKPKKKLGERFNKESEKYVISEMKRRDRKRQIIEILQRWSKRRNQNNDVEIMNNFQFLLENKELDGLPSKPSHIGNGDNGLLIECLIPINDRKQAINETLAVLVNDSTDIPDNDEITDDDLP